MPRQAAWWRGALAGIIVLAGLTTIKLSVDSTLGQPIPFLSYFGAVLVAAWYGGFAAGIVTTGIAAFLGYAGFIAPEAQVDWTRAVVQALVFCVEGLAISWLVARLTTERRQAMASRDAAEQATKQLRVVLDCIDQGITVLDPGGKIVYANDVAAALLGFGSAIELHGASGRELSNRFQIFDAGGMPFPAEELPNRAVLRGEIPGDVVVQFRVPSERATRWSAVRAKGIYDAGGDLQFVVNAFRDVTQERRQAQHREFLNRASVELNSSLDFETALASVVTMAVPHIADWSAVDIVEEGQRKRLAVAHVDPAKVQFVRELERRYPPDANAPGGVGEVLANGTPLLVSEIPEGVLEARARDAEHLRLIRSLQLRSYICVPLTRGESIFGAITLATAESGRRYDEVDLDLAMRLADRAAIAVENARLFGEVRRARNDSEQANRAKDDFLAMLGHELRNPLAPIVTALEIMKLRPNEDARREREIIERQVRHVVRLVDDLLDVSRIVRGRVTLARERVNLSEVVSRAVQAARPLIDERHHEIHVHVEPNLELMTDPVRLTQVLTNLLTNAAKYTEPHGRIGVRVVRSGESVVFRIEDNGMGIAPPMLSQIFDLFVQAPQAIDRSLGGLGLGLTIVQSLVSLFGGHVTAHSDGPGKGSEFVVTLPFEAVPAEVSDGPGSASLRARRPPLRVLVVDDNRDAVEVLGEALELMGYEAYVAQDAEAALVVAHEVSPSVALLDIGLPEMDGYELGQRLRSLPGLQDIRLVALTGYGQAADRARSKSAGWIAHLVKPVDLDAIQSVLERIS